MVGAVVRYSLRYELYPGEAWGEVARTRFSDSDVVSLTLQA